MRHCGVRVVVETFVEMEQAVQALLLDVGQQKDGPGDDFAAGVGAAGRKTPQSRVVVVQSEADLMQMIQTGGSPGGLARRLHRRQ